MKTLLSTVLFTLILSVPLRVAEGGDVTFASDVATIIHSKCASCHRPGQSGPFPLLTYEDVSSRVATIQAVIEDGYMPPWKPVNKNIHFENDRQLTSAELRTLNQWADSGAPQGDPAKTPPLPNFPADWQLGEPDLVIEMEGEFAVPADGPDVYRSFVFKLNLPEDKWVKAFEVKPQARGALHHGVFFLDQNRNARRIDGKDGTAGISGMGFLFNQGESSRSGGLFGRGRLGNQGLESVSDSFGGGLGGYVPGTTPTLLPGDLAKHIPAGSDIVMQTHFHPSGKPEVEHAKLALYFADKPPARRLDGIQLPAAFGRFAGIRVPAGERHFEIEDSIQLNVDVEAIAVFGHAHYICTEMEMTATTPDGRDMTLIKIDDWDLDWQDNYQFASPIALPAGTVIHSRIAYDNSDANPENPYQPPQLIQWGRESTDEMGSLTLTVVPKEVGDQEALRSLTQKHRRESVTKGIGQSFKRGATQGQNTDRFKSNPDLLKRLFDKNRNGLIEREELPEGLRGALFDRTDADRSDSLDDQEIEKARKALERFR